MHWVVESRDARMTHPTACPRVRMVYDGHSTHKNQFVKLTTTNNFSFPSSRLIAPRQPSIAFPFRQ
jgi:hypothetical protein